MLAAEAGVASFPVVHSSREAPAYGQRWCPPGTPLRSVFVVGDEAIGPPGVPAHTAAGCVQLAKAAGLDVAGFEFSAEWLLAFASPCPDLMPGGDRLLDALTGAFKGGRA